MRSVIFSLIKSEEIIRSLSCKNPFCAIVKELQFPKARIEQIPTAIREETTKRANCCGNGKLPLFYIEKDARVGVLYAPFACVPMVYPTGLLRSQSVKSCYKEIKTQTSRYAVRYLATGLQTTVSSVVWSADCPKKIFYEPTTNPFESCN